eukprot:TRINITY_DN10485_c0_g1_i2.p1 TRINITY_DN10485_c0_g1~~TRINITY_DN10485_c0_g1_i2.p1  ORF type:complete len:617 (-),score=181.46 TRINITY_DN10485_c0_g1_i2:242-2092(-)
MASSTATKVTKGAARAAAAAASVSGSTIASWTQRLTAYATSGYEAVYKSQACQASIPECPFVLDYGKSKLVKASVYVDGQLKGLSTWQIILVAIVFWTIFIKLKNFLFADEPLLVRLKGSFFFYMKKIPYVRAKIDEEIGKGLTDMKKSVLKEFPGEKIITELPAKGLTVKQVLKELDFLRELGEVDWQAGHISGTVYHGGDDMADMMKEAYGKFIWSNPLHVAVFPGVRKMESEILAMCIDMFNGGPDACGSTTSGGTESILMAMKAYRDRGRTRGIVKPEIIVPVTAHAAFDKAAGYFGMKITHIPVNPETGAADVRKLARKINRNTVCIVGSCPSFPHGVIDPIPELSALAVKYDIGLHVDACLGGFLVAFMDEAGYPLTPFDFRLKGVSSISVDTHKYGFCTKGSSVVLYSNADLRRYQYFVQPNWPGGIYACPTVAGSRPGAVIAATWAAMMKMGRNGYVKSTKAIIETARYIEEEARKIEGIKVMGHPSVSVVAFGSDDFDINRLVEPLVETRGWDLNVLQFPASLHICCTLVHTEEGVADAFLTALRESVAECMVDRNAKAEGAAAMYGMAQSIPDRSIVDDLARGYIDLTLTPLKQTTSKKGRRKSSK